MSKTEELVALLIERAEYLHDPEAYHGDIREVMLNAADHIQAQQALIDELVGVLEDLRQFARPSNWDEAKAYITEFGRGPDAWRALDAALNRAREENSNE